jgi:2-polyprenyl-3-methyl-5-hydroxy-6-metoxy-1,4-benzoquinol methylase
VTLTSAIENQTERYDGFYRRRRWVHDLLRFDVRYRVRRLHEVLTALRWQANGRSVLDIGFGYGDLLESFPEDCSIWGADISSSAVGAARLDPRFARFREAAFDTIPEDGASALPPGPFDIALSSHTLEHVPDDRAVLRSVHARLRPGGLVAIFVPIEEPDYNLFHLRVY